MDSACLKSAGNTLTSISFCRVLPPKVISTGGTLSAIMVLMPASFKILAVSSANSRCGKRLKMEKSSSVMRLCLIQYGKIYKRNYCERKCDSFLGCL